LLTTLLYLSLLSIAISALPLLIILGGGDGRQLDNEYDRARMVNHGSQIERALNRGIFWIADRRANFLGIGVLGMVICVVFW
jgi:hypothetical protein